MAEKAIPALKLYSECHCTRYSFLNLKYLFFQIETDVSVVISLTKAIVKTLCVNQKSLWQSNKLFVEKILKVHLPVK